MVPFAGGRKSGAVMKKLSDWAELFNDLSPDEAAALLVSFDEWCEIPPFTDRTSAWMRKALLYRIDGNMFPVETIRRDEEANACSFAT